MNDFNAIAGYKNADAFLTAVTDVVKELEGKMCSDCVQSLDNLEEFLDAEDQKLSSLSETIKGWKEDQAAAAYALGELLTIERLARDLNDVEGMTTHYGNIKDTIYDARLSVSTEGGKGFFEGVQKLLNDHISNKDDFIGHKWKSLHLEAVAKASLAVEQEVEEERPHSSTELSMRASIYADTTNTDEPSI